ncbi:Hypp5864 [Branchiostoma lanceolatum]|uniref:Hypp5864 protein n=1 Tax=Branchiostoma lanceolatum TaxID=7740 RepID=A0A8J9YP65_BRALA|nr:Hypp5864 [Branchiostoma lanceolatum]
MAILDNYCCCCTVRLGSLITGVLYVIIHIIDLGVKSSSVALGWNAYGTDVASVVVDVIAIILGLLLIVAVLGSMMALLRGWVALAIIILIVELVIIICFSALTLNIWTVQASGAFWLGPVIGAWVIYYFIFYITIYGVLVVYSHYQNLRDGIDE